MKSKNSCIVLAATVFFSMVPALAQVPPDAGSLRQELERRREQVEPQTPAPTAVTETPAATATAAGQTVTVDAFQFSGNNLLSGEKLAAALQGYLRRPLTFAELQSAVSAVSDAYRESGWIVRAYLPLQEIKDGVVTIAVVEAAFGETRMDGDAPKRVRFERIASMVSAQQDKGAPLNAARLDRALLLINDLPGVTAKGRLAAGSQEGETDLVLTVDDESLFNADVVVDNAGSRSTGELRQIVTGVLNSPLRIGDQYNATLLHADGLSYAYAAASVPVGKNGWRAGAHASYLQYELVAPEFRPLDVEGDSTAIGLDVNYALHRSRTTSLSLALSVDSAKFDNESSDTTTTRYKIESVDVSLIAHKFDDYGGVNIGSLTVTYGDADLSESPNRAADAATTQVDGGFGKLNFFASRQQQITDMVSVYAALSGQLASGNLDSSEKFYLGGASGVRAFPASEAGGDEGLLAVLEGRMRLPANFNVAAFYDWGRITVNRDNDFIGAATLNSFSLQGAGVSVAWASQFGLRLKATWSHRLDDNPQPTADGKDQDGSLKKNRFWLQASMSF